MKKIFISYSHKDSKWLEHLTTALKPLVRNLELDVWDDTKIHAGSDWRYEIENALTSAQIAILLVSQHFLASDFIYNVELSSILTNAEKKGLKIIWIPVSHSLFTETELSRFQSIGDPSKPLSSLNVNQRNKTFVDICIKLKKTLEEDDTNAIPTTNSFNGFTVNSNDETSHSIKIPSLNVNSNTHDVITKIAICDCFYDNVDFFSKNILKELALSINVFPFFEASRIETYISILEKNPNIASHVEEYFADLSKPNSLKELGYWNQIQEFDFVILPCNISDIIREEFFSLITIVKKITNKILIVKYSNKIDKPPSQVLWEKRIDDLTINSILFESSNPDSVILQIIKSNPQLISDEKLKLISHSIQKLIKY